jgi:1-acyl-sn-glycerol-3-phosphate acyltransferase
MLARAREAGGGSPERGSRALRDLFFNLYYWVASIFYTLWAALSALRPGRKSVRRVVKRYVNAMVWGMDAIAGIRIEVRGRENLPQGAYILAPKHASWGDGFSIYAQMDDVAFVTGDHLERFPLFKTVLKKLGAIVVDSCGGPEARAALTRSAADAHREGRKILIYPEGNLAPVGVKYRYRTGVYHMARDFGMPVVPVASSLGLYWPQEAWGKTPGTAVLEFLPPLSPDLDRETFMRQLEAAVEDRTAELIAEATGRPVTPARREVPPAELARRSKEKVGPFTHRLATEADLPALRILMDEAIGELQKGFLTPEQITASRAIMGLDTQLIEDGTYFLVLAETGEIAGSGGWSRRNTLYGGDHTAGRNAALLDPETEAARVRAMYTNPRFARRGVGRMILGLCEAAARDEGFRRVELAGTLSGQPLYRACGYEVIEEILDDRGGVPVPLARMGKAL